MGLYESVVIVSPRASTVKLMKLFRKCIVDVNKCGGLVRGLDNWGTRPLTYPMRRNQNVYRSGHYLRFRFQGSPTAKQLIEHRLRGDDQVVRYMTVAQRDIAPKHAPSPKPLPAPLMGAPEADFLQMATGGEFDYVAARYLLQSGLISREEIAEFPRRSEVEAYKSDVAADMQSATSEAADDNKVESI